MNRSWDEVVGLGSWDDVADGFTWDSLLAGEPVEPGPPILPDPGELPIGTLPVELRTGTDIYRGTQPAAFADSETGSAWWRFCETLTDLLDPIAEVTRPVPWLALANPRECPRAWLNVLAQWAGIRRPDAMSEEDLRILIGEGGPGFWRGTRQNMIASIRRFLPPGTPDNFVYFEERADGNPYALRVFTYAMHTPPEVEEQIRAALLAAKPAGLWPFQYEVRVGQTWRMLRDRKESWAQVNADYENWHEVLTDEPLEVSPL
jgi:hypothetical protein